MITIKKNIPVSYTIRCCKCGALLQYKLEDLRHRLYTDTHEAGKNKFHDDKRYYFIICPNCDEVNYHYIDSGVRFSLEEEV